MSTYVFMQRLPLKFDKRRAVKTFKEGNANRMVQVPDSVSRNQDHQRPRPKTAFMTLSCLATTHNTEMQGEAYFMTLQDWELVDKAFKTDYSILPR